MHRATLIGIIISFLSTIASAQVTGLCRISGQKPTYEPSWPIRHYREIEARMARMPEPVWNVGEEGELRDAVVYIDVPASERPPKVHKPAKINIAAGQFSPRVCCVQRDQPIDLTTTDIGVEHHIFCQTPPSNHPIGKIVRASGRPERIDPFGAGVNILLGCVKEPWISGWICVLDTPYFAVTRSDGTFEIPEKLPDGKYTLHVWHESGTTVEQTITIVSGKASVDITVSVPADTPTGDDDSRPPSLRFGK